MVEDKKVSVRLPESYVEKLDEMRKWTGEKDSALLREGIDAIYSILRGAQEGKIAYLISKTKLEPLVIELESLGIKNKP